MGTEPVPVIPELFTPTEVATALRVSENYVLTQCRSGAWPCVRMARKAIRMSASDIERAIELSRDASTASAASPSFLTPRSQSRRRRSA